MPDNRDDRRQERYQLLRNIGFSSEDAAKYRDEDSETIQRLVNERREELESDDDPDSETMRQRSEISRIAESADSRIFTRRERADLWAEWSNRFIGFPDELLERIRQINSDAGENQFNSFGYRQVYHEFVNRESSDEALELAKQGSP